jgi:hypothetical protein
LAKVELSRDWEFAVDLAVSLESALSPPSDAAQQRHVLQASGQPRPDPMLQLSKFSKMRLAFPATAASPFCTKACPRDLRARPLLDSLAISLVVALDICKGSQCDLEFAEKVIRRRESLLHMDGQTMSECMAAHCKTP